MPRQPQGTPHEKISPFVEQLLLTDRNLRYGMGFVAIVFPIILVALGMLVKFEFDIKPSMSHYYYAFPTAFPLRTWFVGGLWALGCFLILYRGFKDIENYLLTFLGVCAVLVAIIPMTAPKECTVNNVDVCTGPALVWWPWAHGVFAVLVFLSMACIVLFCSRLTFGELDKDGRERYGGIYVLIGIAMLFWPVIVLVVGYFLSPVLWTWRVLAIEVVGVILFGLYWVFKTREINETRADQKAVLGQLRRPLNNPWLEPLRQVGNSLPGGVKKLFSNDNEEPVTGLPFQQELLSQFVHMINDSGTSSPEDVAKSLMAPENWQDAQINQPTSEHLQRCVVVLGKCSEILSGRSLASASAGHVP